MQYLVSALEMAEMDRQTIEKLAIPGRILMETAGRAVAQTCLAHFKHHGKITIACGPGNNGGDGYVTARVLSNLGHKVHVFVFADRIRITGDAHDALLSLEKSNDTTITYVSDTRALVDFSNAVSNSDITIDALLGIGLTNDVRGLLADAIAVINQEAKYVIAIDIPSGIEANTGAVCGRAVQAAQTVTFAFAKRGHYLYPGAELRGQLIVADIGISNNIAQKLGIVGRLITASDLPTLMPKRKPEAHKGIFGTVVIMAGSPETPGAALLAVQGALRSGVGLVRWATDNATLASARELPADTMLLIREDEETSEHWVTRIIDTADAIVIGPGLSQAKSRLEDLRALLACAQVPIIIDADALNLLAIDNTAWSLPRTPMVITPHPKELSRLSGQSVDEIQSDRFASALGFAIAHNCIVVLKGAGTTIADTDGTVSLAAVGNAGLATGGTGDVLSGLIGGLLAQGIEPSIAAQIGVLAHGAAGEQLSQRVGQAGLVASDLSRELGHVWANYKR
ncbi:MAG: NAD(P)H-hydrate dehydratase [Deltaproteobacteria bacterium]|nr:NAD(P)H-hydrate dehydratase [Deltaproteobacteria bacterium]